MDLTEYKKLLTEYTGFGSISTDKAFLPEIEKSVSWLKDLFEKNGFKVGILKGKTCNPIVFASYEVSTKAETVLVYGHYDVQPASREDGWDSEPFKLTEKNGKLYARGVVDNKGQHLIHAHTVFNLIKEKRLKYNVKFLIEGNEETANEDIPKIIRDNKKKLKTNYVLISDGEVRYRPEIEYSLRGGFNVTLRFATAKNNTHSGIYGGAIPNAANELSKFLSKLFDKNNKVTIPNFYKNVDKITSEQIKNNKKLLKSEKEVFENTGVKTLMTETGLDFYTQTGLRPTLQVTGVKAGYIGEGYANIVPAKAEARINFRVVTSQIPIDVYKAFEKFVKVNTPRYVSYELSVASMHKPVRVDISSKKVMEVKKLLKLAFGTEVLIKPVGGAIPVVSDFKEVLGVDTLLVSLGNDDCNMHGVNENYDTALLKKGLKFSEAFFQN